MWSDWNCKRTLLNIHWSWGLASIPIIIIVNWYFLSLSKDPRLERNKKTWPFSDAVFRSSWQAEFELKLPWPDCYWLVELGAAVVSWMYTTGTKNSKKTWRHGCPVKARNHLQRAQHCTYDEFAISPVDQSHIRQFMSCPIAYRKNLIILFPNCDKILRSSLIQRMPPLD